ncbi:MAG: DEAD/DEAH box helicase [Longimicrobiales bacterium]|nr:DEAD/DEAH box helicase [Longimicrobiales bacterium]
MESFDELGVTPELVDALIAEGIEVPTEIQASAIPVLLRGNSLLAQAGPGAGTLIAYGIPLLQRVDPEGTSPQGLVLAPSVESASRLASSLSRLAQVTGHRVGALESRWALPEIASILFATPEDLLRAVRGSKVSLEEIQVVVVDGFSGLQPQSREALETLLGFIPKEGQRILLAQPLTEESEAFGRAHFSKAVHIPPKAALSGGGAQPPRRGEVSYRIVSEEKEAELLQTVATVLEEGAHHALLFFKTEDQAADSGDFLTLHGYMAGAVGEADFPVWLATEELPARKILDDWSDPSAVVTVSVDVPSEPDSLDRRHGGKEAAVILVRSRELSHLRDVARRTGYRLIPAKEPIPTRVSGELERLRSLLERTMKEEELAPYFLALEPLFQNHSPGEVAAAAMALLKRPPPAGRSQEAEGRSVAQEPSSGPPPRSWVRLFVAVGEKDGVGPGDLLGAITGEAGVEASQVGKIEIRDTFSLVEVIPTVADKIIRSINGTTIRGRAVRVDHDRGSPRGRGEASSRPNRKPRGGDRPAGR